MRRGEGRGEGRRGRGKTEGRIDMCGVRGVGRRETMEHLFGCLTCCSHGDVL